MKAVVTGVFLVIASQDAKKPNLPTEQYETRAVEGWTVRVHKELLSGKRERAYAITHHHEDFAEACEAYFGANDFYPFVRAELREHDPAIYRVLDEVWRK